LQGFVRHAACVLFAMTFSVAYSQSAVFSADSVKAAFLYRFASYIEWPADAPAAPFVIAVVGADEVAQQLEELLPQIRIHGAPAEVRRISRAADLEGVHILYIGPRAMQGTRTLRAAAVKRPILIVTDDEDGIDSGGVINFIEASRNVRFEISLIASDRARLKINSALLSVAARVERRPQAASGCADLNVSRYGPMSCVIRVAQAGAGGVR
jgi:hypothetical protein